MECDIVSSHSHLAWNFNRLLPQIMDIFDCVYEWKDKVDTGFQLSVKSFESVKEYGILLRNYHCKSKKGSVVFSYSLWTFLGLILWIWQCWKLPLIIKLLINLTLLKNSFYVVLIIDKFVKEYFIYPVRKHIYYSLYL